MHVKFTVDVFGMSSKELHHPAFTYENRCIVGHFCWGIVYEDDDNKTKNDLLLKKVLLLSFLHLLNVHDQDWQGNSICDLWFLSAHPNTLHQPYTLTLHKSNTRKWIGNPDCISHFWKLLKFLFSIEFKLSCQATLSRKRNLAKWEYTLLAKLGLSIVFTGLLCQSIAPEAV